QLFRRMVFNVLARNCDDHTKNFAFLMDQEGKWSLSPAYDICHAYRPDSVWVSQHCLSINGKRKDFLMDDFLAIAKQNSIRNPQGIIQEVQEVVSQWMDYAQKYKVNSTLAEAIAATLVKLV
ncbi:type II toxin-antitoxin system HipA family toxin, partial [Mongoliitalea lutea]|uniref:type II toxin-antitoxin system HipA family toxin n=3 Tax=Cyclobacteriaceae TaxID=563798 RepID=UPI0035ECDEFD